MLWKVRVVAFERAGGTWGWREGKEVRGW